MQARHIKIMGPTASVNAEGMEDGKRI